VKHDEVILAIDRPIIIRKEPREYNTPHDLAIKAANWAMKDDPRCAAAHQRRMMAKKDLELATRHEVPKARAAFEAADANWRRITTEVFDHVMAQREQRP
jgi:hypothetical protein